MKEQDISNAMKKDQPPSRFKKKREEILANEVDLIFIVSKIMNVFVLAFHTKTIASL